MRCGRRLIFNLPHFILHQRRPAVERTLRIEAYNRKEAEELVTHVQVTHGGWQNVRLDDERVVEDA
jgi:hypothetical protein